MPNPTVYFDLSADGTPLGRVVMEVSIEKADKNELSVKIFLFFFCSCLRM